MIVIGSIIGLVIIVAIVVAVLAGDLATQHNRTETSDSDASDTETTVKTTTEIKSTTITTTSLISNISNISDILYISYIKTELDIISNRSFPLYSTLIYNSEDEILVDGYITTINVSFPQPFDIYLPVDFRLHFFIIMNNSILSSWETVPDYSDFVTFDLSPWTLIVQPGSFLSVATDNGNISSIQSSYLIGNSISVTTTGKAYISSNFFSPYDVIQPQWNGEDIGIALSFIVAHNPQWNGTTPLTTTPTTTTVASMPDINITYGSISEDVLDQSLSLNSLLIFNWEDMCGTDGSIIMITVRFCTPFQSQNTLDGLLWFFVIYGHTEVNARYPVIPSNVSLIQSFLIPEAEFIIEQGNFLSVGTFSNNSSTANAICLQPVGYAYSAEIDNYINDNTIDAEWTGSEMGIALSYVVLYNEALIQTPAPGGPDLK